MSRLFVIITVVVVAGLAGCSEPAAKADPRDQALKDPMNYNPAGGDKPDISGGGIMDFNKNAFKKDVNSVLSP